MPIGFQDIRPYLSVLLARVKDEADPAAVFASLAEEIQHLLRIRSEDEDDMGSVRTQPIVLLEDGDVEHSLLTYRTRRAPPWLTGVAGGERDERAEELGAVDVEQRLVVLSRYERGLAFCLTDDRDRERVRRAFGDTGYDSLGTLRAVPPLDLHARYLGEKVRTLWLSGMHRSVGSKADSKVLSGTDLLYALDPLADQSFYYTAARTRSDWTQRSVGVSPKDGRLWLGPTVDWDDYATNIREVLRRLVHPPGVSTEAFPVLATACSGAVNLGHLDDLLLMPPETMADGALSAEDKAALEKWAHSGSFTVTSPVGPGGAEVDALLYGERVGGLRIWTDASDPMRVGVEIRPEGPEPGQDNELQRLARLAKKRPVLKAYFDSGHTLSDGAIYEPRFRELPYTGFEWQDFTTGVYNVTREKPGPDAQTVDWAVLGTSGSLCCWVWNTWPNGVPSGWLALDDGAMEVADFVHLKLGPRPCLTLIHVKAADSDSVNRRISVSAFEVVVGQAVKNLRNLDHLLLAERLVDGADRIAAGRVRYNGVSGTRTRFVRRLRSITPDVERKVVVVQPHLRKPHVELVRSRIRANGNDADTVRLRQIDALLHSANAACRSLGAEFRVICAS